MDHEPAGVAAAAALLRTLEQHPLEERAAAFDEVHRLLQDALAEVEGA